MNKKLLAAVCVVLSALLLTGCQLAKAEAGTDIEPDRLVGVFVTREHLDLFDFEGYFEDNANKVFSGGLIDDKSGKYNGRLYAERKDGRLEFGGLDGMTLFSGMVSDLEGTYKLSYVDDRISDFRMDNNRIEGTIYTTLGRRTFFINPIYQSPDGSTYLISGEGMTDSAGGTYTQTIEETRTVTENGVETTESFAVSVSIATKLEPDEIIVVQMDKDSNPVRREEFKPRDMPDEIDRHPDAAYIIVETHSSSPDGQDEITRELFEHNLVYYDDCMFTVYLARDDGICAAKTVTVKW